MVNIIVPNIELKIEYTIELQAFAWHPSKEFYEAPQ